MTKRHVHPWIVRIFCLVPGPSPLRGPTSVGSHEFHLSHLSKVSVIKVSQIVVFTKESGITFRTSKPISVKLKYWSLICL